ncbi:MAG: hypothetical protein OEL83_16910 [Desulforhopalus sp.]|nr:hypothetical protein [Desulforhopalus sp.]
MIFFDAHVHIQARFDLDRFFFAALTNFDKQRLDSAQQTAGTYFLLLTEAKFLDFFTVLREEAGQRTALLPSAWTVEATAEPESLLLRHAAWPGVRLFVVAGRQLVAKERLEVLALATTAKIGDGKALVDTVNEVRDAGGLAVLPWGAGKWLGKRGGIVSDFLQNASAASLFVGDNGGRPKIWPRPAPFDLAASRGIRLLPGSDPLPLPGEEKRVGSYGAMVAGGCSDDKPVADLKNLLSESTQPITPFGHRQGAWQFLRTQVGLRLAK